MLNPHADRLDYRELLSPPPGYKTAFITGTTYSLDLDTLTAICAITGLNVEADTELTESPIHVLEALRRASVKLLLFCQGGQISLPDKPNKLLPMLESCVCEISLKNKMSFHPKTWFVRYKAKNLPDRYRLIVLSRNMTFDRSWDVAVRLDSAVKGENTIGMGTNCGTALYGFLAFLSNHAGGHNKALRNKRKLLDALANDILHVNWKSLGKEFDNFDFIPFGIGMDRTDNLDDTFHKLFVISPFLSKSIIDGFSKNRLTDPDCVLITRKSELPKLNAELLAAFETYTVKDDVIDGEERISETSDGRTQDIHAKVYLRTKHSYSDIYIGSANASHSAFIGGNVECLVRLTGKKRYLNIDKLRSDLFGSDEKNNPFERVVPNDYLTAEDDADAKQLEMVIREFCAARKTATVSGSEKYAVIVSMKPLATDIKLKIAPLMKKDSCRPISSNMIWEGLRIGDLSEWYVVTAEVHKKSINRVVKIETKGIPETRDAAIFGSIVNDKNAFLAYIAFLLSDDYLTAFLEHLKRGAEDYQFLNMSYDTPIIYERMLKAASASPDSLREIQDIMTLAEQSGRNVVPFDFTKLYEQFAKAVKI